MTKLFDHPLYRPFAYFLTFATANSLSPVALPGVLGALTRRPAHVSLPHKMRDSRPLTLSEMQRSNGKDGLDSYLSGTSKWDPIYKGVDMFTGNFTMSATDLDFQGGFGIPVSAQRTYSAENGDDGPFGPGWSLSVDVRSTAGGILKSKHAPSFGVPGDFKEIPAGQADPRLATQPAAGVLATDASGQPETIQKDVDGVLTTPPWDNNVSVGTYTYTTYQGNVYQVQTTNTTTTADGTVYSYSTHGQYYLTNDRQGTNPGMWPNGGDQTSPTVPSNVLKIDSVTDRQGNVTSYTYAKCNPLNGMGGSGGYWFQKQNGWTCEDVLSKISDSAGHVLNFTWATGGQNGSHWRIASIDDGNGRKVTYNYGSYGNGYNVLLSVTTPGGKTTQFGYGLPTVFNTAFNPPLPAVTTPLIKSITDPQTRVTQLTWAQDTISFAPYQNASSGQVVAAPIVQQIQNPNGNVTAFIYMGQTMGLCATGANNFPANFYPTNGAYEFTGTPNVNTMSNCYQVLLFSGTAVSNGYQANQYTVGALNPGQTYPVYQNIALSKGNIPMYCTSTVYDPFQQTANFTTTLIPRDSQGYWTNDQMAGFNDEGVVYETQTYNFQGNPLTDTVEQYYQTNSGTKETGSDYLGQAYLDISQEKQYAYWDQSKYYQQKAVADRVGWGGLPSGQTARVSYTDYYPSGSGSGLNGQVEYTYSSPYATFSVAPGGTDQNWANDMTSEGSSPNVTGPYSSYSTYNSHGQYTEVDKLQTVSGGVGTYVKTATVYWGAGSPGFGAAHTVTEDSGGINRTTTTKLYDPSGRATDSIDAAGNEFLTDYNKDEELLDVTNVNHTPYATYSYFANTGDARAYQVQSVSDNLGSVQDTFTYNMSGSGVGMPASVGEGPLDSLPTYTVAYSYGPAGDRQTATYTIGSDLKQWSYNNYAAFGPLSKGSVSRVPQTITQLDGSGNFTPEEFHYLYDTAGRLEASTFAMTPASGFTPTSGNPWYDPTHLASHRAIAVYDNSAGSQNELLGYGWNDWNSGIYSSTAIGQYTYSYDHTTWLKTGATFPDNHSESYGYDPNLDYLTSAYNQGGNGVTETWSYDAAGNRASDSANPGTWTYDNLNRMTASPGLSYSNSATGDRLTTVNNSGTANYGWDVLNRMTSFSPAGGTTTDYGYRADGLRVYKGNAVTGLGTAYAYDGQMGIQDMDFTGYESLNNQWTPTTITDYGIGGRGIDWMQISNANGSQVKYPIFDGHGNMVNTLEKNGTSYGLADPRSYDAWGNILFGYGSGDPKGRYCANLGHKQDDESGLSYMRARYYEATSGRFVSEDPQKNGWNHLVYALDNPVCYCDSTGCSAESDRLAFIGALLKLFGLFLIGGGFCLEYACFPGAIANVINLADEYQSTMGLINSLSQGVDRTIWEQLGDEIRFFKDALIWKKEFNGVRGMLGGAMLAFLGYNMMILGEEFQTEADSIG